MNTPTLLLHSSWIAFSLSMLCGSAPGQDAQFHSIQRLSNREVALKFSAPTGVHYRIDAAVDLAATNPFRWSSLLTVRSVGVNQHTDAAAPYVSSRFYRAEQLSGSNILTGDNLVTTSGDVVIHPINHASFVMSWNGLMIYNDPVGGTTPYAGLARADLICVSHNHSDHFDITTLNAVRGSNGVIIVPPGIYNSSAFAPLRTNAVALSYGDSTNVAGINIEAVPAYNSYHPYGTNNAYVITLGGKRIFTSGDCADGMEIRAVTNIDVAFLCMNVPYTTDARGATNIIRAMRPRVVYPYHYRDQSGTVTNASVFKQWLGADLGIEVRLRKWY